MKSWCISLVVLGLLLGAAPLSRATDFAIDLDDAEQAAMAETFHFALEHNQLNQQSSWFNPDTGHSGTIMPVRSFYSTQGLSCREYFQTLQFDDTLERRLGIACRQPEGVWEVMSEQFLSDPYLELEVSPYQDLDLDPFDRYYPWVYYDPFDYPYPIYFSFVFVSHRHHYQPRHFHSGHRFNTHLFRDGRHLAPRQPDHRDRRPEPPLVREQPNAHRIDRGTAAPRQRVDNERGREQPTPRQRASQRDPSPPRREVVSPEAGARVDAPVRRPAAVVPAPSPPPSEPADNRQRLDRDQSRQRSADPPPADRQVGENRKSGKSGEDDLRAEPRDRGERQLRRDQDNREDQREQRGKEGRRERRDRDDDEERRDRSGGRDHR